MKEWDWKQSLYATLVFVLFYFFYDYLGKYTAQYFDEREATDVRVVVSSQDSEGITRKNFDLNYLKYLEAYLVEQSEVETNKTLGLKGYATIHVKYSSDAIYVESGSMKLAVIRLRVSDRSNHATAVFIVGVVGNELKRITCVRRSAETISVAYGVCGKKIQKVFGEKIGE